MSERLSFTEMLRMTDEKDRAAGEMPLPMQLEALQAEITKLQTRLNEVNAKIERIKRQIKLSNEFEN